MYFYPRFTVSNILLLSSSGLLAKLCSLDDYIDIRHMAEYQKQ